VAVSYLLTLHLLTNSGNDVVNNNIPLTLICIAVNSNTIQM